MKEKEINHKLYEYFFSYIHESLKIPTQIHTNSITDFSFRKVTSNTIHNFINPSKVENNTFFT